MSPFLQTPEGFSPAMLDMLDEAFTAVWSELQESGATESADEEVTPLTVARSISELAATGVREPERLKRYALRAAEQSRLRARPVLHLPA